MCDTLVALGNSTTDGRTLFGKNSDRPPNEAQLVRYFPRKDYDKADMLKCTYVSIPQERVTYAVFLSSPSWLWGGEMGANEHGVAIGNEAVYSNEQVPETGLLGMDLLRLALERGYTARRALDVIVSLLEEHGQGGVCELGGVNKYHNSFLIADKNEAWVLETSDRRWVAQRVKTVRAISNGYTIHSDWDLASGDLIEHAIASGFCQSKEEFDFATAYGNETLRFITHCDDRLNCSTKSLLDTEGKIDFFQIASILRNHPDGWTPWKQDVTPVCQHSNQNGGSSTTGSQISEIGGECTHWFTGSSSPCISVYWPFDFEKPHVYSGFDVGGFKYSDRSYWWRREKANRALAVRYGPQGMRFPEVVALQQEAYRSHSRTTDVRKMDALIRKHESLLENLVARSPIIDDLDPEYSAYWKTKNAEAGFDQDQ
ncbi:MAG: hypothetical protein C4K49_09820 [Candidatus Thorarchaeota archaeon]|nr:MAG: hypothetical protein C4K49_09820 [Candidatus Thorarchaeota archaeon]